MKVRIKNFNGELRWYLTNGKEYELIREESETQTGIINDDVGDVLYILMDGCGHLGGGSWEVVE